MTAFDQSRRHMVRSLISGSMLLPAIVQDLLASSGDSVTAKTPHFTAKAKRVIFMYMSGGASHTDSFDYKPKLIQDGKDGKKSANGRTLLPPQWEFKPRGKSGTYVSDLFPHIGGCADDLCIVNSMKGDHNDHFQATLGIHTGSVSVTRPSIGSWVSYGLGTENQNLPSFVVLAPKLPYCGGQVWSSDFLPGVHSGTHVQAGADPVPNLVRRAPAPEVQQLELDLIARMNQRHMEKRPGEAALSARMKSFETAYGMQQQMPQVLDLSKESHATLKLYGLERGSSKGFGWQCLIARRLIESGVRFIELIDSGSSNNWDAHGDIHTHKPLAENVDLAAAGLLKDLKSRGLLKDTLVVWTTEFGRSPYAEGTIGRGHYNKVFSSWLAGGGVKPGLVYGKSDEYGIDVAEDLCHVHDFHATILHLLGFDHTKLTYRFGGRDYRLTDVAGNVVERIIA